MNYAYIRVSTELQSYEGQCYEVQNWSLRRNIPIDSWVQEKVSGTAQLNKRRFIGGFDLKFIICINIYV